jgi:hypothetical protein
MALPAQFQERIARFREVFWEKRRGNRPPVGVVSPAVYLPIGYCRRPFPGVIVDPSDITAEVARTDYQFAFAGKSVRVDDYLPFSAPWRAVPWLEACSGCGVRHASGSLAPDACVARLDDLPLAPIPASNGWLECLRRETERLAATATEDCWISPTILRGNADVLAAMRGLSNFYCDLHDGPEILDATAARANRLLLDVLAMHYRIVGEKHGGFGHIFGYWAPHPTIVLQEDVLGMCGPAIYRDIFRRHNVEAVRAMGPCVLFHLHSTGYRHWRHVLDIPGIAGLEITVEANGPSLEEMLPVFREILERSRLILFVDHGFAGLARVLRRLPREGLYVIVRDDDITSDTQFQDFVAEAWAR